MKQGRGFSMMSGTVAQVDPQHRTLTVRGLVMNKTFDVAADAAIRTDAKPQAGLADLQTGQPVEVRYEQHESICIAHLIDQSAQQYRQAA